MTLRAGATKTEVVVVQRPRDQSTVFFSLCCACLTLRRRHRSFHGQACGITYVTTRVMPSRQPRATLTSQVVSSTSVWAAYVATRVVPSRQPRATLTSQVVSSTSVWAAYVTTRAMPSKQPRATLTSQVVSCYQDDLLAAIIMSLRRRQVCALLTFLQVSGTVHLRVVLHNYDIVFNVRYVYNVSVKDH